jgi:hypothetical protein
LSNDVVKKIESSSKELLKNLEKQIHEIESCMHDVKSSINELETQIHVHYHAQIFRIQELTRLYKKQKLEKKQKRSDQKKKGKNYREPNQLLSVKNTSNENDALDESTALEIKQLYREALMIVHPDKFNNAADELRDRAHALTLEVIDSYKSGNTDRLKLFHGHILSGNAMMHVPFDEHSIVNEQEMVIFLNKRKQELEKQLSYIKSSNLYTVISTYENPQTFVGELASFFELRIKQLEKRTRSKKTGK